MIELRHLAYFISACQHLHLAKAAAEMDVAQSTLSMALKAIEEDVGVPLLAPAKVGLLPTPPALWLFQATTPLLHAESFARQYASRVMSEQVEQVVIRPRLIFTIGRFAKAISCVIEKLRLRFPSTYFQPKWDATNHDGPGVFGGAAASVTIDYDATAGSEDAEWLLDDPWVLAREMPTSASEPELAELMAGPVVIPALPSYLLEQASQFVASAALPNARFTRDGPGELPRLAGAAPDTAFLIPNSILSIRLGLLRMRTVVVPGLSSRIVARTEGDSAAAAAFVEALREHLAGEEKNVVFKPQLTLRQFRYFRTIYQSRHLTVAARTANIAQPALSSQLLKVETMIGRRLFERHHDGLLPTAAGHQLFQASAAVSTMAAKLEAGKQLAGSTTGAVLRIGILPALDQTSMMTSAINDCITRWLKLHPGVRLQALEGPNELLQRWLLDGTVALAVVETELPQLARFRLGSAEDLCVIGSPRFELMSADTITFEGLLAMPLVLPTAASGIRQALDSAAASIGSKLRPQIEINSLAMLIAFVLENPMATVLPESAVRREIAAGLLRASRIVEPKVQRKLYVIYSNERPLSAAESDFVRLMRSSMDQKDPSRDEISPASATRSDQQA